MLMVASCSVSKFTQEGLSLFLKCTLEGQSLHSKYIWNAPLKDLKFLVWVVRIAVSHPSGGRLAMSLVANYFHHSSCEFLSLGILLYVPVYPCMLFVIFIIFFSTAAGIDVP